ncbi:Ca2-binding protein [Aureococcus anophagefferens]|nr:Ca2-binding protein [Aureococcus anophagefferens]
MVLNLITRDLSKPKARRVAPSLLKPSLPEEKVDGDERIARQASPISITEDDFTIGDLVGESMAEGLRAVTPSPEILRESTAPGLAAAGSPPSPEILRDYFSRLGAAPEPPRRRRRRPRRPRCGGPDAEWLLNATALRDRHARDEVAANVARRNSCPDLVERATGRSDRRSPDMSLVAGVSDRRLPERRHEARRFVRSESNSSLADMASKSPDLSPRRALLRAASSPSFSRSARSYEAVDDRTGGGDGDRFLKEMTSMPLAKVVQVVLLSRVGRLRAIVGGLRALVAGDGVDGAAVGLAAPAPATSRSSTRPAAATPRA